MKKQCKNKDLEFLYEMKKNVDKLAEIYDLNNLNLVKQMIDVWIEDLEISQPENNGWIKLNGLPNEIKNNGDILIFTKNGDIEVCLENQFLEIGYATHYQPIEIPKPPIC